MGKLGIIISAGGAGTRMVVPDAGSGNSGPVTDNLNAGRGGVAPTPDSAQTVETAAELTAALPKQFMPLAGRPVLAHSLDAFRAVAPEAEVVVALPADHVETWAELCRKHNIAPHKICVGGATRSLSVQNALAELDPECEIIAVHDGARPLVSPGSILRAIETARWHGSAVPVVPVVDSVRRIVDQAARESSTDDAGPAAEGDEAISGISHPEDRTALVAVQTPQVFRADILRKAYEAAAKRADERTFTDDATCVEAAGYNVRLCAGERRNIKITEPDDLKIAEALMKI